MIRELDSYSMYAIGAGCFMNGDQQQRIRDPLTGELRRERVFTTDREIEIDHLDRTVEFGERAAAELAHLLGWVAPGVHRDLTLKASELEKERDDATTKSAEDGAASLVNVRQAAEAIIKAEELADEVEALTSKLKSFRSQVSQLRKQVKDSKTEAKAISSFGDA